MICGLWMKLGNSLLVVVYSVLKHLLPQPIKYGRGPRTVRMYLATFGWSKKADGSCLLRDECDNKKDQSKVLVSVYGPCPVKTKSELIDRATVQVVVQPLNYPPGGESDAWANKLERLLQESIVNVEEHPRSLIQVAIQPLNIGTNFVTVMVNAIFLALLHSAVPLRRPFVAVSRNPQRDIFICDPLNGRVLFQECEGAFPDKISLDIMHSVYAELKETFSSCTANH